MNGDGSIKGKETMVFCTVVNSYYLDRLLVMFDSLRSSCDNDFRLYVVAFDDACFDCLESIDDRRLIPIARSDFESPGLLSVKSERSNSEYMWTCSSHSIRYILDTFSEDSCTYIDADLFFYSSPRPLFDELKESDADVGIMAHGYIDTPENNRYMSYSGKYCVEFNYFKNNDNGRRVLDWWCDSCIECCQMLQDGIHFGDQKYLEQFETLFDNVHVFEHKGAGVAPWNLAAYRLKTWDNIESGVESYSDDPIRLERWIGESSNKPVELIFYHFQQISFISRCMADIHLHMYPYKPQRQLTVLLYSDYMNRLMAKRAELVDKCNIDLWAKQGFTKKEKISEFMDSIVRYERNPMIAIRRIVRWLLYRSSDYVTIDDLQETGA